MQESMGTVTFPPYLYPRSLATKSLWGSYLVSDASALFYTKETAVHPYVWVTVYKTMTITQSETDLFLEGLKIIETEGLIGGFQPANYATAPPPPPKGGKAFLVCCHNTDALRRIVQKKVWTIQTKTKSGTFFIQHDDSWATHVILDIHNAGPDFVKEVLLKLY